MLCFVELVNLGGCWLIEWYSCCEFVIRSYCGVNRLCCGDCVLFLKENVVMLFLFVDEFVEFD